MSLLGWWAAGRALAPLEAVSATAKSIDAETLNLSIPRRGADDELDQLIDSFNNMVTRLQNSFAQMRQFSADVSHELRTPLTAIRGELEVALMTNASAEQMREAIAHAIDDVDRMTNTVRSLLRLSQAESGQVTLARDRIELAGLASDVIDQFRTPADFSGLTVTSVLPAGSFVMGDRVQLERLLSNLLSNAIKYTPAGGSIGVSVFQRDGFVDLVVQDTGRGIPAEHLPHVFDRLYRVPDGARTPDQGLGLGLSFVSWIAKVHGAKVKVESTPGSGTRFTVTFPVAGEAAPNIFSESPQLALKS
jgi:heavy metal sensor kinase